jgi:RimJ/RimL family protein N-acetyltransferase
MSPVLSRPRVRVLATGAPVVIRLLRRDDERALRAAFDSLSEHSRYQRFLAPVSSLSDRMWRYLCDVDGVDHIALAAFVPGEHRLLGVARCVRLRQEPECAEMAVTVVDAMQRRGLGSALVDLLVEAAVSRGYRTLLAYALSDNLGVRKLLARHGTFVPRPAGEVAPFFDSHAIRVDLAGARRDARGSSLNLPGRGARLGS